MRNFLSTPLLLGGCLTLAGCSGFFYNQYRALQRWRLGISSSNLTVENNQVALSHKGKEGPAVLLLHGFGSDRDSWNQVMAQLEGPMRLIAPDLPGWGETSYRPDTVYSPEQQATAIEQLRIAMGLQKVHIVGHSMGGEIGGVYAAMFPDNIASLTLIDTAGVGGPILSEFNRQLMTGKNPMIIRQPEDLDALLTLAFHKVPEMPWPSKRLFFDMSSARASQNEKLFKEIFGPGPVLESYLPKVKAPVLTIWGQKDRIVDVSSIQVIQRIKPEVVVTVLKDCGHMPIYEQVAETNQALRDFIIKNAK